LTVSEFLRHSTLEQYAHVGSAKIVSKLAGSQTAGPPTRCFGPQVLSTSKEVLTLATITGTSSNNLLNGTSSADTINGLGGNDTINGGAGNDTINGGTGLDVMTGGAGADSFVFVSGDAINTEPHDRITDFQVGVDRLVLPGAILSTEDQASGFYVHYANNNNSWLLLEGVHNPDLAQLTNPTGGTPQPPTGPTAGNDTLNGTSGNDNIDALAGNDVVNGLAGNDTLAGGAGNDTLNGGDGNDILIGGAGTDDMTGGAGMDIFRFVGGQGGNVEPHDHVRDFTFGQDVLDLSGQTIVGYQEQAGVGTYVHYGSTANHWLLLDGKFGMTDLQKAQLTDPNATGGGGGPPPGGGDIPAHTVVIHNTFDNNNRGVFTNWWGNVGFVNVGGDAGIRVTSPYGSFADAGAMQQGAGLGYGLYEFTVQANTSGAPGPYGLLWPQNNVWPGAELDVFEQLPGGQVYATIHWDSNPNQVSNEDNAFQSYFAPGNIRLTDKHIFSFVWYEENGTPVANVFVDGEQFAHITEHIPFDAAHGGLNSLVGVGEQTLWSAGQQTGNNSLTLFDFTFSTLDTVIA
jgi:hypothetical protein